MIDEANRIPGYLLFLKSNLIIRKCRSDQRKQEFVQPFILVQRCSFTHTVVSGKTNLENIYPALILAGAKINSCASATVS